MNGHICTFFPEDPFILGEDKLKLLGLYICSILYMDGKYFMVITYDFKYAGLESSNIERQHSIYKDLSHKQLLSKLSTIKKPKQLNIFWGRGIDAKIIGEYERVISKL